MLELEAEPILKISAVLGEGSLWDWERNVLLWVDIDQFLLHTYDPATGNNTSVNVGDYVGTVVKHAGGGFVVGLGHRFAHVDEKGKVSTICEVEKNTGNRMNDGKCDPSGRFWCGSMDFNLAPGKGNLWMLDADRHVHHILGNVTCSNGLVWTSDRRLMYYIDTPTGHLDVFDYDDETGAISNRRVAVKNQWGGHFDGMTIDAEDNVYIAAWGGGAVYKIDPQKGTLIAKINVPGVKNVTSCALGGPNMNDLFITSSGKNANPSSEPNAGDLFKIRLDGTTGVRAFEYHG